MSQEIKAPLRALRVLVVEDNAIIGMLYAELLAEMGHAVCAIEATETDAVTAAGHYKPDLMIVDAALDEGSGVSAVEEILRTGFVPHVFVSGNAAAVQALRPGAIVIQKPFQDPDLARAIQRALAATLSRGSSHSAGCSSSSS
jgi:CheY-like chemotaxis protein